MKFKGTIGTQYSGSLAGVTASHNKGGTYYRQRSIPVNPNSAQQQEVRTAFTTLATRWRGILTQAQRDNWYAYAQGTPITDRIGDSIIIPGLAMYQRTNVPRIQAGFGIIDDAPTQPGLPEFTIPTVNQLAASDDAYSIGFANTDDWANDDNGALYLYGSSNKSNALVYYKGPYRFAGVIQGDATTPPTSPAEIVSAYPVNALRRFFWMIRIQDGEGRLSNPIRGTVLSVAL